MTPADKLQKTCGCWSKSAGNWAKRILVYGFSKVSTWEYTGSSCNFNSRHCHLQSDMILVHANKNEFVKSLDILRSLKKKGGGDYHLWCPVRSIPFFPIYAILLYKLYIQLEVWKVCHYPRHILIAAQSLKSLYIELTSCHYHTQYFAALVSLMHYQ